MTTKPKIQVGDCLKLSSIHAHNGIDSSTYTTVTRETNTRWVCASDHQVDKLDLWVHGQEFKAEKIEGAGVSLCFEVQDDKAAERMTVMSDLLESYGLKAQGLELKALVDRYRESLKPRDASDLKPAWLAGPHYGRKDYQLRERKIGSVERLYSNHEDVWQATYNAPNKAPEVLKPDDSSEFKDLRYAKSAIMDRYKAEGCEP